MFRKTVITESGGRIAVRHHSSESSKWALQKTAAALAHAQEMHRVIDFKPSDAPSRSSSAALEERAKAEQLRADEVISVLISEDIRNEGDEKSLAYNNDQLSRPLIPGTIPVQTQRVYPTLPAEQELFPLPKALSNIIFCKHLEWRDRTTLLAHPQFAHYTTIAQKSFDDILYDLNFFDVDEKYWKSAEEKITQDPGILLFKSDAISNSSNTLYQAVFKKVRDKKIKADALKKLQPFFIQAFDSNINLARKEIIKQLGEIDPLYYSVLTSFEAEIDLSRDDIIEKFRECNKKLLDSAYRSLTSGNNESHKDLEKLIKTFPHLLLNKIETLSPSDTHVTLYQIATGTSWQFINHCGGCKHCIPDGDYEWWHHWYKEHPEGKRYLCTDIPKMLEGYFIQAFNGDKTKANKEIWKQLKEYWKISKTEHQIPHLSYVLRTLESIGSTEIEIKIGIDAIAKYICSVSLNRENSDKHYQYFALQKTSNNLYLSIIKNKKLITQGKIFLMESIHDECNDWFYKQMRRPFSFTLSCFLHKINISWFLLNDHFINEIYQLKQDDIRLFKPLLTTAYYHFITDFCDYYIYGYYSARNENNDIRETLISTLKTPAFHQKMFQLILPPDNKMSEKETIEHNSMLKNILGKLLGQSFFHGTDEQNDIQNLFCRCYVFSRTSCLDVEEAYENIKNYRSFFTCNFNIDTIKYIADLKILMLLKTHNNELKKDKIEKKPRIAQFLKKSRLGLFTCLGSAETAEEKYFYGITGERVNNDPATEADVTHSMKELDDAMGATLFALHHP